MKPPAKTPVVEKPPTPGQIAKAAARRAAMGLAPLASLGGGRNAGKTEATRQLIANAESGGVRVVQARKVMAEALAKKPKPKKARKARPKPKRTAKPKVAR